MIIQSQNFFTAYCEVFAYTEGVHNSLIMVLNWASLNTITSLVHFGDHEKRIFLELGIFPSQNFMVQ